MTLVERIWTTTLFRLQREFSQKLHERVLDTSNE
jgi:hypothetical protein